MSGLPFVEDGGSDTEGVETEDGFHLVDVALRVWAIDSD
jgi:hypothetical protein